MRTSAPEVTHDLADPGILVIEAATAELALEEVHARLGGDAEILAADRVTRGGVGGFFAREIVQLRARRPGGAVRPPDLVAPAAMADPAAAIAAAAARRPDLVAPAEPPPAEAPPRGVGLEGMLADLVAQTGSEERSFAEVLRGKLPEMAEAVPAPAAPAPAPAHAPAPASPPPAPVSQVPASSPAALQSQPSAPVAAPAAAWPASGPVVPAPALLSEELQAIQTDWSLANLQRLGLPMIVLDAVRGLDIRDEAAWVAGIARAVGTLTRPLPTGPAALAGPRAAKLAKALDVETVTVGAQVRPGRTFAVATRGGEQARSWLAWSRGRRWLHVVVGGEGWRPLLFDEPLAVSWVGDEHLCEAVRLSAELGLVLGYGVNGGTAHRATPLEIALAIRDLLPRR